MDADRDFRARYDTLAKTVTIVVIAVLCIVAVAADSWVIAALNLLLIAGTFAYSPRGYRVEGNDVLVRRPLHHLSIKGVDAARRVTPEELSGSLRLFASGGLFGYFGLFRGAALGNAWWYVTDRSTAVLLRTADGSQAVVSPDDPVSFLEQLKVSEGTVEQTISGRSGAPTWIWSALVCVVAAVAVVFAFAYSPGPPRYTLTSGALQIHDRFYPVTIGAESVNVDGIRVIDFVSEPEWRPTARTNGFANSRYRAGWFRTANGHRVRMYRTDGSRLVLLPPRGDGNPVLIEAAEPELLVTQLRRAWSAVD